MQGWQFTHLHPKTNPTSITLPVTHTYTQSTHKLTENLCNLYLCFSCFGVGLNQCQKAKYHSERAELISSCSRGLLH